MKFSRSVLGAAVAVAISALALPASADTYSFNDGGSAFPSPGNYGSVTLTQDGANVDFSVVVYDPFDFVNTGNPQTAHAAFTFNATGVALAEITAISMTGGGGTLYAATNPGGNSPFGNFSFGIYGDCAGNCPASGPLTFTVLNASVADFLSKSTGGTPNAYFAADIIGPGGTGAVGVTNVTPPVPEPGTYALMFAGLGVVGFMARRRKQQA
jgi:hypothetical protein